MGKTKIIATVGPSTNSKQKLKELILKGCDAIRINMRQCDYTFCDLVFQMVDELNKDLNNQPLSFLMIDEMPVTYFHNRHLEPIPLLSNRFLLF